MTKRRQWARIFTAAVMLHTSPPLSAAEFQKSAIPNAQADLITVVGDLAPGDEKKFVDVALGSSDAIVAFQSRGGNLLAGIEIGKAIHLKGFATVVPDGICASACALEVASVYREEMLALAFMQYIQTATANRR